LAIADAPAAALRAPVRSPIDTLEDVLAHTDRPLTVVELRQACRMRTAHVCQALAALTAQGRVHKTAAIEPLAIWERAVTSNRQR
jgi:hypothetical protein